MKGYSFEIFAYDRTRDRYRYVDTMRDTKLERAVEKWVECTGSSCEDFLVKYQGSVDPMIAKVTVKKAQIVVEAGGK